MKLTKTSVEKLQYQGQGNSTFTVFDDEVAGFGVRVYPTGKRSFFIDYRIGGRQRRMVLGQFGVLTVDQARKLAQQRLGEILSGHDPLETKTAGQRIPVMESLCLEFLDQYSRKHKRSWREDERRIHKHIIPALGKRKANTIKRADIMALHNHLGEIHPYEANRVLALLSVMFEYGRKTGLLPENFINPARGIDKFKEQRRDRWVRPEEMPRLAEAIDREPNIYFRGALWLYILTGVRKSELLRAKWEDIDVGRSELRLPTTKAGRVHYVPLSKPAMEILQSIPRLEGNPYVLPGLNGNHLVNIDKPWRRIRKTAGLPDVRLHDLRRTVGSWLASAGHSLPLIGKVLNHSNASTTQIYAHLTEDPIKKAMQEHGEKVIQIAHLRENTEAKEVV